MIDHEEIFDFVVVGGGPAGATAADDLASRGRKVALLDRSGRIKPCGGAIPPRLIRDFAIPSHLLKARVRLATMISPKGQSVDMPIDGGGFVGMVDRDSFDEWLRDRAAKSGATRFVGRYEKITRNGDGVVRVHFAPKAGAPEQILKTRFVIGADGANSTVGRQEVPGATRGRFVFAYHEIIATPVDEAKQSGESRCEIHYRGTLSPDFYAWIFPHGDTMSVGSGSAKKGFSLKTSVGSLRSLTGLQDAKTIRREGAPIPMKPLRRWDNGRDVVLAGRRGGRCRPGFRRRDLLRDARWAAGGGGGREGARDRRRTRRCGWRARAFMREHGRVFWVLGMMQYFWYSNDKRRERFVSICRDPDVQRLTWEVLHEQGASPPRSDGACADLFQGSCSSSEACAAMMMGFFSERGIEIVIAAAAVSVVALIGGLMTDVGPWYEGLRFPRLRPPNWLFGPAWTVIFILIAAAGVVAWESAENPTARFRLVTLFLINGVLNLLWSPLFFKLRRPDWALYELLLFWLSILGSHCRSGSSFEFRRMAAGSLSGLGHLCRMAQLARRRS